MSFADMSPEKRTEVSRSGGIASGEARRAKRKQLEWMKLHDASLEEMRAALRIAEHRAQTAQAEVTYLRIVKARTGATR